MSTRRAIPAVNAALAAIIVAVVAGFALVAVPPSPPGIAEFAPRASRPITRAPHTQAEAASSRACPVPTCDPLGRPSPTPGARPTSAVAPGLGAPSALQCYRWPDGSVTQTFDPQSPPCIASWPEAAKGNGGRTSMGVNANEVRVVVDELRLSRQAWSAFARFFDTRYQLYGRRLRLVFQQPTGKNTDPSVQRADAQRTIAARPFARTDYNYVYRSTVFPDQVTKGGVVYLTAARVPSDTTSAQADARPGQLWSWYPEVDRRLDATGRFLCSSLAGRPATGTTDERVFAVLRPRPTEGRPASVAPLVQQAAVCGAAIEVVDYPAGESQDFQSLHTSPTLSATMADLRSRGVTTLFTMSFNEDLLALMGAAQRSAYHPEWVSAGTIYGEDLGFRTMPQAQMARFFGLDRNETLRLPTETTWYRAMSQMDPALAEELTGAPLIGGTPVADQAYAALQLLATGLQAAGPRLTPATMTAGVQALRYPNPGAGGPPYWQQTVGFGDGDFSAVEDYALRSWRPTRSRRDGEAGTWCYWQRGKRFHPDAFPSNYDPQGEDVTC